MLCHPTHASQFSKPHSLPLSTFLHPLLHVMLFVEHAQAQFMVSSLPNPLTESSSSSLSHHWHVLPMKQYPQSNIQLYTQLFSSDHPAEHFMQEKRTPILPGSRENPYYYMFDIGLTPSSPNIMSHSLPLSTSLYTSTCTPFAVEDFPLIWTN